MLVRKRSSLRLLFLCVSLSLSLLSLKLCQGLTTVLAAGSDVIPFHRSAPPSCDRPPQTVAAARSAAEVRARKVVDADVATALYNGKDYGGLVVLDNVVGVEHIRHVRCDAEEWRERGILTRTGFEDEEPVDPKWEKYLGQVPKLRIFDRACAEAEGAVGLSFATAFLECMCKELNRHAPAGAPRVQPGTMQLACYNGGGTSYQVHTDGCLQSELEEVEAAQQHLTAAARRVTAILYLQEDWSSESGGVFRGHRAAVDRGEPACGHVDIQPRGGTLVLFRSRDLAHEVLPAYSLRFALSLWCHVVTE